jgi:serine dehydrogenase proteinase
MPTWIQTKAEIDRRKGDYDGVRRERIASVEKITERPLVIYATAFLDRNKLQAAQGEVGIDAFDPVAFDEVIGPLEGDRLDVLLHSPGGSPDAAEGIVSLLRSRFNHLRFIVPHMAKSAATMICCAGDEILMDERGELGPIDPQMQLIRADGRVIFSPAQAILKQFDKAKESLATNPKQITAWLPIIQPLGPSLLTECETANALSRKLVEKWLKAYMFSSSADKDQLASNFAEYLADSEIHLSHGRRIDIEQLKEYKVNVTDLRSNPPLRDAVWGLYHAIHWSLQDTAAFKIVETCHDSAYIRQIIVQQIPISTPLGAGLQQAPPQAPQFGQKKTRKRHN